jgi:hypothetical protein
MLRIERPTVIEESRASMDFTFPHAADIEVDDVAATAEPHCSGDGCFEHKMRSWFGVTEGYSDTYCTYGLRTDHNRY